jgi:hypothetical protein
MSDREFRPMDPQLEQAIQEIRDATLDPAEMEAAAARVWPRLAAELPAPSPRERVLGCAEFQAMLPEFRAARLSEARTLLLRDHLHECVACRKVYEGRVAVLPEPPARNIHHRIRWGAAAAVIVGIGISIWVASSNRGGRGGKAVVQNVNGALYAISADGIRLLSSGQDLPDGVELRTAPGSDAVVRLRDGSLVEMRERSSVSTAQTAEDLMLRLSRGSIIVQAAKRRRGHLYVTTADCRVAVTGTVFSVSSGVKGSRVSVIEGEVRVSQNQEEKVLRPGEQTVTSATLAPLPMREEIAWSRNRERLFRQLDALKVSLNQIRLPAVRYDSALLKRLPADIAFFASIPNLAQYLGAAQAVFHQKLEESPELRRWWAGGAARAEAVLEKLRAGSEYLGEEVIIVASPQESGQMDAPVFLAETKREGFAEFVRQQAIPATVAAKPGVVVFGPVQRAVERMAAALDRPGAFPGTPFYQRIVSAYREGAGFLFCADISHWHAGPRMPAFRYLIAEQKEIQGQMETRATVDFGGPRTGVAAWLADPSPMGSLEYISPEATLVAAFVVTSPTVILDEIAALPFGAVASIKRALDEARQEGGGDARANLAASLGNEFSLSLDGPPFPVPSWKLAAECYEPGRFQTALRKLVEVYNREAARAGRKPLRTGQETANGRTDYWIAGGDPNPLTEVHYTFAGGYVVAAPTRALLSRALQVKASGVSITHSSRFLEMEPRDRYANFSALVYQNLGTTLAPLASLFGAFIPQNGPGASNAVQHLGTMKPMFVAAYGAPDHITIAGSGGMLGSALTNILNGNIVGLAGHGLPFGGQ